MKKFTQKHRDKLIIGIEETEQDGNRYYKLV